MSYKTTLKRIVRRGGHLLGLLLLVAIVVPFVIYAVPGVVGADYSFVVLSGSMEPVASPGDAIIVERVDAAAIERGDVIAFQKGQSSIPTTHRVVEATLTDTGLAFATKGDANADVDPELVPASRVIGRVMTVEGYLFVIPYIGRVILFIETPLGFATLVALPLSLLVVSEVWSFVRKTRAENRTIDEPTAAETIGGADRQIETDDSSDVGSGLTVSRDALGLVLPVLAAFAAYSVWTATQQLTSLSIAVAVGTGVFLFVGLVLYVGVGWSTDSTPAQASVGATSPDGGVVEGVAGLPATPIDPPTVTVDSFENLLVVARAGDRAVAWDSEETGYRTVGGPVSFLFDGDPTIVQDASPSDEPPLLALTSDDEPRSTIDDPAIWELFDASVFDRTVDEHTDFDLGLSEEEMSDHDHLGRADGDETDDELPDEDDDPWSILFASPGTVISDEPDDPEATTVEADYWRSLR
jgi:signal peptidase